jgi:hypothetical protein
MENNKISGAMAGFLAAGLASINRYDTETQRRIRNAKEDSRDALDQIADYKSSGEQIRGRLPVVMDAQIGLALANPTQVAPEILPTQTRLTRPTFEEESVGDLSWPPRPGNYDAKARVSEIGELSRTFLALTFQEVRAFIEGLAQAKSPGQAGLLQISRAANQLIAVAASLNLSAAQYAAAWQRLFTGAAATNSDPHAGVPVIGIPNAANNVVAVTFAPSSVKSDRAMRLRITSGSKCDYYWCGCCYSDICIAEWKDASGSPMTPAIFGSQGLFAAAASSTGIYSASEPSDWLATPRRSTRSLRMEEAMPTSLLDEVKKLTTDPGARRVAQAVDELKARLDVCCPPPTSLKAETKKEES